MMSAVHQWLTEVEQSFCGVALEMLENQCEWKLFFKLFIISILRIEPRDQSSFMP